MGRDDDGFAFLDYPSLLVGDLLDSVAQCGYVVEAYGGNHRNRGINDVCGVEPAAQSDFDDLKIGFDVLIVLKRHCGHQLEERNTVVPALRADPLDGGP